jgi:hypothetical protein
MTQTDTGPAHKSGDGASGPSDSLDSLRADLARLILNEAGQALGRNPDLPLSAALVQAVERQAAQTAQETRNQIPSAQALADAVVEAVSPELVRIAQAAGAGDTARLTRRPAKAATGTLPLALAGAGLGALLFVAGFLTARFLPQPQPEAPPAAVAPAEPTLTVVDPDAPAATGEAVQAPATPPASTRTGRPAQ